MRGELEKRHYLTLLMDLYEELLPPRQRQVLSLRLDEDMSWGEMAEDLGTTRQACEDAFRRGAKSLERYEKVLGLIEKEKKHQEIMQLAEDMNRENWDECKQRILSFHINHKEAGEHGI